MISFSLQPSFPPHGPLPHRHSVVHSLFCQLHLKSYLSPLPSFHLHSYHPNPIPCILFWTSIIISLFFFLPPITILPTLAGSCPHLPWQPRLVHPLPRPFHCGHIDPVMISHTCQIHPHFRSFALEISSVWNALCSDRAKSPHPSKKSTI